MELSEMTLKAVLHTYSSVKGHQTRCEKEIDNLLVLLGARYSPISEERINDRLEKLERHTLRLADIKDYLVHLKYARAEDHEIEVQEFLDILDKWQITAVGASNLEHISTRDNSMPCPARNSRHSLTTVWMMSSAHVLTEKRRRPRQFTQTYRDS